MDYEKELLLLLLALGIHVGRPHWSRAVVSGAVLSTPNSSPHRLPSLFSSSLSLSRGLAVRHYTANSSHTCLFRDDLKQVLRFPAPTWTQRKTSTNLPAGSLAISRRFGGATKPNLFSSRSSDCFFPCLCFGYERQGTMTREKRGLDAGDGDSLHPEPKRPKVPALAR
ncbi:hypothetical protein B296_00001327 [Ensete ventricosum]|uniref:Uncharacterized protein n=1 Tax=Ensete ventricosum TaxID=4639 RepID=A0A427B5J5_ENSVE|nr:hypothetical protein B296_00001327 [Ensete ventricosum]